MCVGESSSPIPLNTLFFINPSKPKASEEQVETNLNLDFTAITRNTSTPALAKFKLPLAAMV
jgi:hypothetical protein